MERPGGSAEAPDEAAPLLPRPPPPPSSGTAGSPGGKGPGGARGVPVPSRCPGLCSARCSLALLAHGSLLVAYALRAALSIAIIAITGGPPSANRTESPALTPAPRPHQAPAYNWSAETQGIVLSSFFYGYGLTQALGGYGAGLLGGKLVLGSGLLLSSALTLLVPRAAELGAGFLVGLQALLGLAQVGRAQYTLWAKWAPPLGTQLAHEYRCTFGTFSALLVAGFICQSLGWPLVFYIFGGVGCAWCLCWFLLVYEDPASHPWISAGEREYIVASLAHQGSSHGLSLPLGAMAKSLPLWAIAIACFCTDWLFYMLLTSMPTFMSSVLHFDLSENGLLSSLPYIGNGLGHILAGLLADFLLARRVLRNSSWMLLPSIFLVAVPYIGCSSTAAVVLLTLALTIISMTGAGININHIDIAPRYAGFLLGVTNTLGIISGIIAPTAVGLLVSQVIWGGTAPHGPVRVYSGMG
uniref:Solute carrier family 17 member 4 n=1 Tax=Anas platyrhynchos TaxID=8839 RepID=A0A8B9SPF5_ANAPL